MLNCKRGQPRDFAGGQASLRQSAYSRSGTSLHVARAARKFLHKLESPWAPSKSPARGWGSVCEHGDRELGRCNWKSQPRSRRRLRPAPRRSPLACGTTAKSKTLHCRLPQPWPGTSRLRHPFGIKELANWRRTFCNQWQRRGFSTRYSKGDNPLRLCSMMAAPSARPKYRLRRSAGRRPTRVRMISPLIWRPTFHSPLNFTPYSCEGAQPRQGSDRSGRFLAGCRASPARPLVGNANPARRKDKAWARRLPKPDRRCTLQLLAASCDAPRKRSCAPTASPSRSWSSWSAPGLPPPRRSASAPATPWWKSPRCGSRRKGHSKRW